MKLNENQYRLIRFFKCLSNKTRFLVLKVLSGNDEISITELSRILNSSVSTTSKHLSILKNLYLVNCRIKGKYVYYKLKNRRIISVINNFEKLFDRKNTVKN
ncbi:winged helix-turn-helix transcriptional regulator [Candidatus Dependentiae bacterium]|nr:winged helix-turn-helix transcriptional regulator [Candidatus Dependentiae bacterium]